MRRIYSRRSLTLLLLALCAGCLAALSACGGGKSEEDVEAMLDKAFEQPVRSADVSIDAELEISGLQGFEAPIRIQAEGPYIGSGDGLPQLNMDLTVGSQEGGQSVESGFLSTGDRAFVKFGGEFYEQPAEDVARANEELRKGAGEEDQGSLRDLGLDPRRWVVDAESKDEEEVAGVTVDHVAGRLDVKALFTDLNKLVQRSGGAVTGEGGDAPQPLAEADIDRLSEVVESPSFDVYIGKDDDVIRRVSAALDIKVPEADRAAAGGIEGGALRFTVELGDVNGDQKVEAPADARPIADLEEQLGGLGALGAGALGGEQPAQPQPAAPADPGAAVPPAGAQQAPAGPDTTDFDRYSECLDQAGADDSTAISRCAELLR